MTTAIDHHLDDVLIRQLTWKPGSMSAVAARIVAHALTHGEVWPDDVDLHGIRLDDRNCVGSAYRNLAGRAGILAQTDDCRRSTRPESSGRRIYRYRLASAHRARTFLDRNPSNLNPQLTLF